MSHVLLVAVSLLPLILITNPGTVGIPHAVSNSAGSNPRLQKSPGLYHTPTSLLCYLVAGATLSSFWLIFARLTASGHLTAPPTTSPVIVARTQSPLRWCVRPLRVSVGILGLLLLEACIAPNLRYPLPFGTQPWSAHGQPVDEPRNHDP